MICDAHLHGIYSTLSPFCDDAYYACSCAHSVDEWHKQQSLLRSITSDRFVIASAFGIHPQMPLIQNVDFLESLLQQHRLAAIGEMGYDLFTPEFKATIEQQKLVWHAQLELAVTYDMSIVVHCRKALDLLFADKASLKKLPAVLFHSFPASDREALSLLQQGINAYFSFGKQILNGNKKAISCVTNLPADRLLLETDAPYQTLKGEIHTLPSEITRVYTKAYELRSLTTAEQRSAFDNQVYANFAAIFAHIAYSL